MSAVRRKTTTTARSRKTTGARKARTTRSPAAPKKSTHEQIAEQAYYIWQSKGCPWGQSLENWLEAERQLKL